jgi:hypothetical protein
MKKPLVLSGYALLSLTYSYKEKETDSITPAMNDTIIKGDADFKGKVVNSWWKRNYVNLSSGVSCIDSVYFKTINSTTGTVHNNALSNEIGNWNITDGNDYTLFRQTNKNNTGDFTNRIDSITDNQLTITTIETGTVTNFYR